MLPYEVSIGLILIVRLVSAIGSAKAIARMLVIGIEQTYFYYLREEFIVPPRKPGSGCMTLSN